VDFALSNDQLELQRHARQFLAQRYPIDRVARIADGDGFDRSEWREAADLGWTGISIAEARGGTGLSFLEEALLVEELGRGLYPGPFLSGVVLALHAVRSAGRAPQRGPAGHVRMGR
jgi:alkylation response protein AidB-like acyl-CoA dehydrogenase